MFVMFVANGMIGTIGSVIMESKFLEFNELNAKRKTKVFEVRNKKTDFFLGTIQWRGGWRQYVFTPTREDSDWSAGCLADVSNFIKQLMEERKVAKC